MPGLLIIGMTAYQTPQDRAFNISQGTGVPTPYKVAASFETQSPYKVEQKIHALLNDYRLRSEREFFKLELEAAIEIIKQHIIKIKPPKATIEKEINSASQKIIIDKKIQ